MQNKQIGTYIGAIVLLCLSPCVVMSMESRAQEVQRGSSMVLEQDTVALTLDEALQVALSANKTVKIAEKEIEKASYDKRTMVAKLFPNISVDGQYNYTLKKQVMYLGGGMKLPGMPEGAAKKGIEVGRTYTVSGGIQAAMPLLNPTLWTSLSISSENARLAVLKAEESLVELQNQVSKAFYGVQLAQESYTVISESYRNAQENLEEINKKYELGLVAQFDKISAEVSVKNIEPTLQTARNSVDNAKMMLKILLSINTDTPIVCKGRLVDKERTVYADDPQVLQRPIDGNFSLKTLDKQLNILKLQERASLSAFSPTISLSGYYRINAMDNEFNWKNYQWTPTSAIAVTVSIPIFSAGERFARLKASKIATSQVRMQRDLLEQKVRQEEHLYRSNMTAAVKKFVSAKEAVALARKGYEIAKKRYEVGASTLVELNQSNLSLLQAGLNYNEAIYDYLSNQADLRKLYGTSGAIVEL